MSVVLRKRKNEPEVYFHILVRSIMIHEYGSVSYSSGNLGEVHVLLRFLKWKACFRKQAEYCFESTVSDVCAANSVSDEKKLGEFALAHTQIVGCKELSEFSPRNSVRTERQGREIRVPIPGRHGYFYGPNTSLVRMISLVFRGKSKRLRGQRNFEKMPCNRVPIQRSNFPEKAH